MSYDTKDVESTKRMKSPVAGGVGRAQNLGGDANPPAPRPMPRSAARQATFAFVSNLARITLTFTATTDLEVRNLVLEYQLAIVPVLLPRETRRSDDVEGDRSGRGAGQEQTRTTTW